MGFFVFTQTSIMSCRVVIRFPVFGEGVYSDQSKRLRLKWSLWIDNTIDNTSANLHPPLVKITSTKHKWQCQYRINITVTSWTYDSACLFIYTVDMYIYIIWIECTGLFHITRERTCYQNEWNVVLCSPVLVRDTKIELHNLLHEKRDYIASARVCTVSAGARAVHCPIKPLLTLNAGRWGAGLLRLLPSNVDHLWFAQQITYFQIQNGEKNCWLCRWICVFAQECIVVIHSTWQRTREIISLIRYCIFIATYSQTWGDELLSKIGFKNISVHFIDPKTVRREDDLCSFPHNDY